MISIGKLTNAESAVAYLEHAIAENQLDYYAHQGESPGQWDGTGAQLLQLQGQVTPDQLRLLLSGLHPTTGKPLAHKWHSQRIVAFDVTFSAPKSVSLLYAIGNDEVRKAVLEAHYQAVDAVVQYLQRHAGFARMYDRGTETVFPVAANMVMPRFVHRTSRPVTDPRTGKTTVDPQLHTHIPIPTWVCRPDGSWSALLSQPLYQHAAAAGAVGQAVMRKHLVEKLGVRVEVMPNGTFEIAGINEAMRREFSKRRQQIEVAEAMFGQMDIAGREKANLATREKKPEVKAGPELVVEWNERAHRVGLTQKLVTHLLHRHEVKRTLELTEESIASLVGEHGLTEENATFSRRDVVRKITTLAPDGMTLQQCEWAVDQVIGGTHVVSLGRPAADVASAFSQSLGHELTDVNSPLPIPIPTLEHARQTASRPSITLLNGQKSSQPVPTPGVPAFDEQPKQLLTTGVERGVGENPGRLSPTASPEGGAGGNSGGFSPATEDRDESARILLTEPRYSTPEMVQLEKRMLEISLARRNSGVCQMPQATVDSALAAHPTLTAEQQNMVMSLCISGDGVIVVEGVAGAGKTYALNVVREIFQSQGSQVLGLALAGRAAQTLEEEANIPSFTLARSIPHLLTESLKSGTLVIVDEAGMVGSRQLAKLVEIAARDNAKLVLCGDSHQLQPIDAGAPFRALGESLGKIELRESIRHKEEWEKEALLALREGAVIEAVSAYIEKERVVVAESVMERRRMVVTEAMAATGRGEDAVVLTQSRNEATAINELSRHVLKLNGELGGPSVEVDGKEFAVGDRVICTRNDSRIGVTNGLRGEVVDVSGDSLTLRTKNGDLAIDAPKYRHLDYGYALTAHKAQGITVDVALVVGSEVASREWVYSVMSRARGETRYFTIAKSPTMEIDALNHVKDDLTVAQKLSRAWSPLEAKESTLDHSISRLG